MSSKRYKPLDEMTDEEVAAEREAHRTWVNEQIKTIEPPDYVPDSSVVEVPDLDSEPSVQGP